jgi:hypothetical protein
MPGENTLYNVSRGLNRRTSTKARNTGSSYGMNASTASNNNMSSVMNRHNTASQSNYGDRRTSRVSMQQRRMSITRTNDRKNLAAEPFQVCYDIQFRPYVTVHLVDMMMQPLHRHCLRQYLLRGICDFLTDSSSPAMGVVSR